ncbi:MAG: prepilin-type N-terminal cleavage/methylation domain-containing protein [Candidatus Acidiferrales bacterium]
MLMQPQMSRRRKSAAAGFTLIELLIAILLLLVGISAVAQLIPAAMTRNFLNRYDSTGLIIAQRQLEQMMNQSMTAGSPAAGNHYFYNTTLPNGTAVTINLGLNNPPGPSDAGAATITDPSGNIYIDWGEAPGAVPANYRNQYVSTEGYLYETRWRVMTFYQTLSGTVQPTAKRIVISTRGGPEGMSQAPTTLVTIVGLRQ